MSEIALPESALEWKTLIRETVREAVQEWFPDLRTRIEAIEEKVGQLSTRADATETRLDSASEAYASKSEVERLAAAHSARDRQVTVQIAELTNVQADNNAKYKAIQDKIGEIDSLKTTIGTLSSAVDTMSTNLNTYMAHGRDTLKTQAEDIKNLKEGVASNKDRIADTEQRYIETYVPMHDYIMGSKTQKPMKEVIGGLESTLSAQGLQLVGQGQQLKTIADYVAAQQKKEDEERNYWKRFRRNMATPQGALRALTVIIMIIIFAQAFSLDQFFARLQQLRLALGH